jgi:hypothetical protein
LKVFIPSDEHANLCGVAFWKNFRYRLNAAEVAYFKEKT